jgi:hypothetical protein
MLGAVAASGCHEIELARKGELRDLGMNDAAVRAVLCACRSA